MTAMPPSNDVLFQLEILMVAGTAISCVSFFGQPRRDFLRHLMLLLGNAAVIRWNLWICVTAQKEGGALGWLVPTTHGGGIGLAELYGMAGGSFAVEGHDLTFSFLAARWCGFIGLILLCTAFFREMVSAFYGQFSSRSAQVKRAA